MKISKSRPDLLNHFPSLLDVAAPVCVAIQLYLRPTKMNSPSSALFYALKKNVVSVRGKKYFIKLVKIKNTEDEQLSYANNRLGTTSPARDLSFYAKTFVVGGWLSRNALWVMTFLTLSTYVRSTLKRKMFSLHSVAVLFSYSLKTFEKVRKLWTKIFPKSTTIVI